MKTAFVGIVIGVMFAIVASGSSCSVSHRSGDFSCTKTADCNDGRQCIDGFCVIPGSIDAAHSDAPHDTGSGCPAGCTTCNVAQKTCTIDCSVANCTNAVACPSGYKCDIQCKTDNSCRNGVSCTGGTACTVECSGKNSCQNVTCGLGPCDVSCSGVQSCRGVACSSSCACDVTCTGTQSCADTISCSSVGCKLGSGCTSVPLACHSCP